MNELGIPQRALMYRVRMYVSEDESWHGQPTVTAVLEFLRREGCSGASVFKGIAGFGAHGHIHTALLVDVVAPLPVVIEWVDTPDRVGRFLPALCGMVVGLITVEDVYAAKVPPRVLRDVPAGLRVSDVMTPASRVDVAFPDTNLSDLVQLLLRNRRNAIPVIDRDRRVAGIVTNRDLVERAGLPLRLELLRALGDPNEPSVAVHLSALHGDGRTAESIMTPQVVTIGPDVPLAKAAQLMLVRRLKRLPVVDDDGRLVGMLSRFDVLKTVTRNPDRADAPAPSASSLHDQPPRLIGEVMNRDVPVVRLDTPLADVLDAVMTTRLHRAVVVDSDGRPVGGVVDTDLMQRVTPTAHPRLIDTLMGRAHLGSPDQRAQWQQRTGQRAADVMRTRDQILVVAADTPIADVIDQALARNIKLVVVTDAHDRVVGMADRADLLAALLPAM